MKYILPLSTIILLITGCGPQLPVEYRPVQEKPKPKPTPTPKPAIIPVKPTKVHELKEVQDTNFNPEYMYPETSGKKVEKAVSKQPDIPVSSSVMSKEECITMIGQERFDKYTQMLGGESGAIKRCTMLKTMK